MMNKYDFAESVGMMHEYFIEESMKGSAQMKERIITKWSTLAASVCLFLAAGLFAWHLSHGNVTPPIDSLVDTTVYGTDSVTEPDTTAPDTTAEDTETDTTAPEETTAPETRIDEDEAVRIAYAAMPDGVNLEQHTCVKDEYEGAEAYRVTIGSRTTWKYEFMITVAGGVIVNSEIKYPEEVPLTKITADMLRDRETIISSDILVERYGGLKDAVRMYSENIYREQVKEVTRLRGVYFDHEYESIIGYDSEHIEYIEVEYYAVIYEGGKIRGFKTYTVASDFAFIYLSGIEEYSGCILSSHEDVLRYISLDSRFADRLSPEAEYIVGDGVMEYNLGAVIEASGVKKLYRDTPEVYMEYSLRSASLTDPFSASNENELYFYIYAINCYTDESGTYLVAYNTRTGKVSLLSSAEEDGAGDSPTVYDCGTFTIYYDDREDLYLRYKRDGKVVLLSDNVTDRDVNEILETEEFEEFPIGLFRWNGEVMVWRDKTVIFGVYGWEDVIEYDIFDVETGKLTVYDNGCVPVRGLTGDRLYVMPYWETFDEDGYDELYYIDLLSGDYDTLIPVETATRYLQEVSISRQMAISPDGRFIVIELSDPSTADMTHIEYAVIDTYSGESREYRVDTGGIYGHICGFDAKMQPYIIATIYEKNYAYVLEW